MNTSLQSIQVFFGADGIKQVYEECLKEKRLDIVCLANNYEQIIGDYFKNDFAPKVYGEIKTREILPDTSENRKDAESKNKSVNAVRFIKNDTSESDMLLSKNRVVLISFRNSLSMAIIISEPEIVKSLKSQFDALWTGLAG